MNETPVMLTIAGSDCSAGAGIQADMKAAHALGTFALTAVTCVVAEVPGIVQGIQEISADIVRSQIKMCMQHFPVKAVKTGMLYSQEIVKVVHECLYDQDVCLVVDPVMIATAGDRLMRQEAVEVCERLLFPMATLLTPNLDEAMVLAGWDIAPEAETMTTLATLLAKKYQCAILLKGGHLSGDCVDILVSADGTLSGVWRRSRILGVSTHGTGCSLSSAIAARLAAGDSLPTACDQGLSLVAKSIAESYRWDSPTVIEALHLL